MIELGAAVAAVFVLPLGTLLSGLLFVALS